jgi:spore coat polysaccharide biosynthesis protein SpsF
MIQETPLGFNKPRDSAFVAIIQGRMGSSRLPGKIVMDIGGEPMLFRVVTRVRRAQLVGQVVVATTTDPGDDPVAEFCLSRGIPCYRGHPQDVLDRYYQAGLLFSAQTVVRLTADCPLIDPKEIDRTIRAFFEAGVDFAANRLPPPWKRTTPIGMDTEVATMNAVARAWHEAKAPYEREHVMPYLYEKAGRFDTLLVNHEPDLGHLRLTVDTAQDLALIRQVYSYFGNRDDFSLSEILDALEVHPEWLSINAGVVHKTFKDIDQRQTER